MIMEENELLSISELQPREKKPDSKFYNYLFAFFFGAFIGAVSVYWALSPAFIEICNHGTK